MASEQKAVGTEKFTGFRPRTGEFSGILLANDKTMKGGANTMLIFDSLLILVLIATDQLIKHAVVVNIALGGQHVLVPGWLSLTHLRNDGAAWGILQGQLWFFAVIAIFALGVMGYFFWHYRHRPKQWVEELGLAFMIAGTVGNFIDRLVQGYVVDMFQLDFINFPIFNFADSCLTVGVILIMIGVFLADRREEHQSHGN